MLKSKILVFIIISIRSFLLFSNEKFCEASVLNSLIDNKENLKIKKELSNAKLTSTNGIEVEGVIPFFLNSVQNVTENVVQHLKVNWNGLVKNIRIIRSGDDSLKVSFEFKGRSKYFLVAHEDTSFADFNKEFVGIELSSHVIDDLDDYALFLSIYSKFFKSGVMAEPTTSGIHNHVGLKDILGRKVEHALDGDIKKFTTDFKKIEIELFEYFGTHPFRSPTSGPINENAIPTNKSQAVILSQANRSGDYLTLEFRYLNSMNNPTKLIESTNFNNLLVQKYFNPETGVKDWFQSPNGNLKDLFLLLNLSYNKRSHHLGILGIPFKSDSMHLNIFGDKVSKVIRFLANYISKNVNKEDHVKGALNELLKYVAYLKTQYKVSNMQIELLIKKIISKNKKLIRPEVLLTLLIRTHQFKLMPNKIKKVILESILKDGLTSLPRSELNKILSKDFYTAFKDYPFTKNEMTEFFRIARLEKNIEAGASILKLQNPSFEQSLLSLGKIQGVFKRQVYKHLLESDETLSTVAKNHLTKLLN